MTMAPKTRKKAAKKKTAPRKKKATTKKKGIKPGRRGHPRKDLDWKVIRRDYEAGIMSVAAIEKKHKLSRGGIYDRAKREGWSDRKDIAKTIREAAQRASIRNELKRASETGKGKTGAKKGGKDAASASGDASSEITEAAIDLYADILERVLSSHKVTIQARRALADKLAKRLNELTDPARIKAALDELIALRLQAIADFEKMPESEQKKRRRPQPISLMELLNGELGILGDAAAIFKTLAQTDGIYIGEERKAFGIGEDDGKEEGSYDELAAILERRQAQRIAGVKPSAAGRVH